MIDIRKGILKAWNAGTYKADVQITGSLAAWLPSVPVSRALESDDMVAGRSVAVLFPDPSNPDDCVVVAVWT